MKKWKWAPVPLVMAALGASLAWGQPAQQPRALENPLFRKLDANRDGFVSRAEAKQARGIDGAFAEADDNRDGRLSSDEFIKAESINERRLAAAYIDDAVVTAKVKAALAKDLGAPALAISVETYHGHVILSGFLDEARDARRAREIAAAVQGVTGISSALQTKVAFSSSAAGSTR